MRRKGLRNVETKYVQARGRTIEGGNDVPDPNTMVGTLSEVQAGDPAVAINNCNPKLWVTDISQGTGEGARVGNKVFIKDFKFRGMISANTSSSAANEVWFKILVVRVKDAESFDATSPYSIRVPNLKQIYEFIGDPWDIDDPVEFGGRDAFAMNWRWYNNRWSNDFTILKSWKVKVARDTGTDDEKKLIKFNIRVNQPARWDGGEPQDGHIFVFWYCDQLRNDNAAVGNSTVRPVLRYSYRVTYTDI